MDFRGNLTSSRPKIEQLLVRNGGLNKYLDEIFFSTCVRIELGTMGIPAQTLHTVLYRPHASFTLLLSISNFPAEMFVYFSFMFP